MHTINLSIVEIINETEDTKTFILQPIGENVPEYLPGQFITLLFQQGEKELRRTYSLSSSPFTDSLLSIAVKRIDNGAVSRILHEQSKPGDLLKALPPAGMFTYEFLPAAKRDLFLIGAGSGIAPLYSILKSTILMEPNANVTLIYSNRSIENSIFYNDLQSLAKEYSDRLKIIWLFSNAKNLLMARLNRELLEKLVAEHLTVAKEDALFYTCGPADYMMMCRITLLTMGFDQTQIKKETFVLPDDEADEDDNGEPKIIDTSTYAVKLNHHGIDYTLEIPYNKSILDVALEEGINLPYSCRAGMCSTCAANLTSGTVRMQYNEVLTDRDIERGRVLLCTAHPMDDEVTVVAG
jgi:ring-1,2-phenylacetyl-CoA epoxidase subunit PaaE